MIGNEDLVLDIPLNKNLSFVGYMSIWFRHWHRGHPTTVFPRLISKLHQWQIAFKKALSQFIPTSTLGRTSTSISGFKVWSVDLVHQHFLKRPTRKRELRKSLVINHYKVGIHINYPTFLESKYSLKIVSLGSAFIAI